MRTSETIYSELRQATATSDWARCIELGREGIDITPPSDFELWHAFRIHLCYFLLHGPKRDRLPADREEAIAVYEGMLEPVSNAKDAEKLASLHRNLGYAYAHRIEGNKDGNLAYVIDHYRQAAGFFCEDQHLGDWASMQAEIGLALLRIGNGDLRENLQQAIEHCEAALRVQTEEEYPEERQETSATLEEARGKLMAL